MYFPKQNIGCNLPLLHFSDFLIKWCYLFHRHFCSEIIWIIKWPRLWLQAFCILERVAFVGTAKFFIRTPLAKLTSTEHMEILTWISDLGSLSSSQNMLWFMKLADIAGKRWINTTEKAVHIFYFIFYIFYFIYL